MGIRIIKSVEDEVDIDVIMSNVSQGIQDPIDSIKGYDIGDLGDPPPGCGKTIGLTSTGLKDHTQRI